MYAILHLQMYKGETIFWWENGKFSNRLFAEHWNELFASAINRDKMVCSPPNKLFPAAKRKKKSCLHAKQCFSLRSVREIMVRPQQLIFCALKACLLLLQQKTWFLYTSTPKTSKECEKWRIIICLCSQGTPYFRTECRNLLLIGDSYCWAFWKTPLGGYTPKEIYKSTSV